jgi:hypothetical protein
MLQFIITHSAHIFSNINPTESYEQDTVVSTCVKLKFALKILPYFTVGNCSRRSRIKILTHSRSRIKMLLLCNTA